MAKRPTLSGFVVLQPGQTYKTIADVNVLVPRANPVSSIIGPGSHYLRIGVWTWDESQEKAKRVRRKWRREGVLWSETILSKPMPFAVVTQPKPEDCYCRNPKINEDQAVNIATRRMNASIRSAIPYRPVAFEQGCEWHVVFEPSDKDANKASLIYIIDKRTGRILEELQ